MKDEILSRAVEAAEYIVRTGATAWAGAENSASANPPFTRTCACVCRKSTGIWPGRWTGAGCNRSQRHLRGGDATRAKYVALRRRPPGHSV